MRTFAASIAAVFLIVFGWTGCGSDSSALVAADADAGDGSSEFGDGGPGLCKGDGTSCAGPAECCSNRCESGVCAPAAGCTVNGAGCSAGASCCSNQCQNGTCSPATCQSKGAQCCGNGDCCSGTCTNGTCADNPTTGPGLCLFPTTACTAHGQCCSGLCVPTVGVAGQAKCADACRGNGVACTRAQDCCSLGCFNGVCAAKFCLTPGDKCTVNAECCSGVCNTSKGECDVDPPNSQCRPAGEDCGSGPQSGCCFATPQDDLCNKSIDPQRSRCAFPPSACKGNTADCASDAQCCSKKCDPNTKKCVDACVPDGQACGCKGVCTQRCPECCGGFCNNGVCSSTPPPAPDGGTATPDAGGTTPGGLPLGSPCSQSSQCASTLCLGGVCAIVPR